MLLALMDKVGQADVATAPPSAPVSRQYLIPEFGYVNVVEDGREYLISGMGYINTAGTP